MTIGSSHGRRLCLVGALTFALAMLPAVANSEPLTVEAVNEGIYTHSWAHGQQTVLSGESVTFANATEVSHGVEWRSAVKPVCEEGAGKVPVGNTPAVSGTKWSGKCTFSQPGTYTFYCTVHGAAMSGTITVTNPGEPTVTTGAATSVTESEATLNGTVNPGGHATTYFFKYGTTTSYGSKTSVQSAGEGTADVAAAPTALKGLLPGTAYHFKLVAKNEKGEVQGSDQTFTTASPPGPPSVTTGEASASESSVTLKGTVDPDGETTKYVFDYGTSTAYGQQSTEVVLPATDHLGHSVSATVTGLTAGTRYHFRLRATNAGGHAEGADREFTTTSPPAPPSSAPSSPTPSPPTTTTPSGSVQAVTEPPALISPLAAGSLKLLVGHRGGSLRVSLAVVRGGAPARVEIDLLAKVAHSHKRALVGRLVRGSVAAGKASFSIALNARGKSLLRHRRRLPAIVKVTLTPPIGARLVAVTRKVVLRA
jgi:plastocyanin